jgi:hypothetical protein
MTRALLPRWGAPQFLLMALVSITMVAVTPGFLQATNSLVSASQSLWTGVLPKSDVAPFRLQTADLVERQEAIACLADAVFYEAGNEPEQGQRAVAQVVVNRVRDPNFPASVCGVVYQGFNRKTGCQFSFVCDNSIFRRPPNEAQKQAAERIAQEALDGYVEVSVGSATHYHAQYVNPYWRPTLVEIAQVGQHIFYKWPGHAGEPDALSQAYAGGEARVQQAALTSLTARRDAHSKA